MRSQVGPSRTKEALSRNFSYGMHHDCHTESGAISAESIFGGKHNTVRDYIESFEDDGREFEPGLDGIAPNR